MSFGTNYYGVDHFDAIVTVNLTGMLVMVTLYQTVNDNLPTTSSIKMIDIWMLFALAIPFMEVILHTAMAWLRQKHEWKNTQPVVDMAGRNQIDETYEAEPRTHIATSGVKVGPHEKVIKGLIKEAIKEAVSSAGTTNDQDQISLAEWESNSIIGGGNTWNTETQGSNKKHNLR